MRKRRTLLSGLHAILATFSSGPLAFNFCDHKNLLYVFSPTHEVKRHIRGKLQRWALSLTGLPYRIEHIDGEANVWADLLSRWDSLSSGEVGVHVQCKFMTRNQQRLDDAASRQLDELRPRQGDFVFPTLEEIKHQQQKRQQTAPANVTTDEEGTMTIEDRIWTRTRPKSYGNASLSWPIVVTRVIVDWTP